MIAELPEIATLGDIEYIRKDIANNTVKSFIEKIINICEQEFGPEMLRTLIEPHVKDITHVPTQNVVKSDYNRRQIENILYKDKSIFYKSIKVSDDGHLLFTGRKSLLTIKHIHQIDDFLRSHNPLTKKDLKKLETMMPIKMNALHQVIYNLIYGKLDMVLYDDEISQGYTPKDMHPFTVTYQKAKTLYNLGGVENGRFKMAKGGPLDLTVRQVQFVNRNIINRMHCTNPITYGEIKDIIKQHLHNKNEQPWTMLKLQTVVYNIEHGIFDDFLKDNTNQVTLC